MSLIKIEAIFSCDGCGNRFTANLDPAGKLSDSWTLFDQAVDTIKNGILAYSVEAGMHLCSKCTKLVCRDKRFVDRDPTEEEIEQLLAENACHICGMLTTMREYAHGRPLCLDCFGRSSP